ncbi:MAG: hypothetical protein K0Q66_6 [Chitinophagaceae bacterium]|nr:hypothetical protein [Chitinophagaceae bacterium]
MVILVALGSYLLIGYFLHLVVFPEQKPEVSTYFTPGQVFYSKAEGFRQTVVKQENGRVYCALEIEPFADGPPKHIHTGFDETFALSKGMLSVWVDGKVVRLQPGDTLFVPRGTPHQPFNETADTLRLQGDVSFPEKFAYYLPQVYGVMDNVPGFGKGPGTVMQMSLFSSNGFDSYIAEGPPVVVQKALSFLLTPLTRVLGYKSFYKEYDIRSKG